MLAAVIATALAPAALAPLQIKGRSFVDPTGKPVLLRGVNLGGWLVEEIWMTPWAEDRPADVPTDWPEKVGDHKSLWTVVEKRLGKEAMLRVRKAWRDHWITENDFARIKKAGFNHVRVPFLYHLIDEPNGMDWLHKAVAWAKKNDLYVVLDLHGTPGGQSGEHHTGERDRNRLWFDVENIARFEQVWTRVGKEFADEPAVAVYDLMNEPMGAPNPAMLHLVYDRVVRAVRKVAPKKPILIDDGYKGFETTPHPNVPGWEQVAFSLHFYQFESKRPQDHVASLKERMGRIKELQGYRDAPLYIGEFNLEPHGNSDNMREFTGLMSEQGWSWALWTYKAIAKSGPMGQWGFYRKAGPADVLDPYRDSEETLIRKMRQVLTENLENPPGLNPFPGLAPK